jgi:glutamine amidotransferase
MFEQKPLQVAIVDYGLGNLFSVKHACKHVGLQAHITCSKPEILQAEAVILPGVGAFGDAMAKLEKLDLVTVMQDIAVSGKPLMGICLGMQLLMTESDEFGRHKGLGIVEGPVVQFESPREDNRTLKVPQIGWNRILKAMGSDVSVDPWTGTLLQGIGDREYMYFVHSYIAQPRITSVCLSTTRYGHIEYCSSLHFGNIHAFQFHPERSGSIGIRIYQNLSSLLGRRTMGENE